MSLALLPVPRHVHFLGGVFIAGASTTVCLEEPLPDTLHKITESFCIQVKKRFGWEWPVIVSGAGGISLFINPGMVIQEQGYTLEISSAGIQVVGHDEAGLFYGLSTLFQILEQAGDHLPCLNIHDWPDFLARGVMLDISRDKVPSMGTLYNLVDLFSSWKINQLQLYMEHTFAYQDHQEVWADASPLTGEEIRELDAYCTERFIELVPNQNSFGHMNRWLAHERYASLAEVIEGFEAPWGKEKGPFSLCPVDPQSLVFINKLYDELLPHFSSLKLNVGLDETYDLGQGRSKDHCEQKGRGQVYLDFLLEVYAALNRRGRTMMYWADMVQEHPELIPYLPKDAIALEWGYEGDHPFAEHCARLQSAGIPFYVCPGTSAWSSIAGRSENALQNLLNAAVSGKKFGATGYLITDWGDNGHWQPLPVSFLGIVAGAAFAWAIDSNREMNIITALNQHVFFDAADVLGKLAYELGNIYQATEIEWANASVLSAILQRPLEALGVHPKVRKVPFEKVLNKIDEITQPLKKAGLDPYAREFALAARLLRHACWRGILAVKSYSQGGTSTNGNGQHPPANQVLQDELYDDLREIIDEYEQVWLLRNRPGGLSDSTARLKLLLKDYQQQN